MKPIRIILILLFAGFLTAVPYSNAQDKTDAAAEKEKPSIAISEEMDDVVIREATKVKEEFQQKARSLFDRFPLDWDLNTITYLYHLALSLPGRIPVFTRFVIAQSQVLGVIGSILVFVFIAAVLYSLLGQRRVMDWVEHRVEPLSAFIPEATYPFVMSGIKVIVMVFRISSIRPVGVDQDLVHRCCFYSHYAALSRTRAFSENLVSEAGPHR